MSLFTCKDTVETYSAGKERPLTSWEKMSMRMHFLICSTCRQYRDQVDALIQFSKKLGRAERASAERLSEEKRQRIAEAMERAAAESDAGT